MIVFAPASANDATCRSGRSTIRCTSRCSPRSRSARQTGGPIDSGGTKCPSITSMWMTSAPAACTAATCSRRRPKSAERTDGAISIGIGEGMMTGWAAGVGCGRLVRWRRGGERPAPASFTPNVPEWAL